MLHPVIAIVGRQNVGKSTLFNCLTRSRDALVSSYPGMTRDRQYGKCFHQNREFIVIDTGGMGDETREIDVLTTEQTHKAIQESNMLLFVVDARAGLTAADLALAKKFRRLNKSILLVINKMDGLDAEIALADFHALGLKDASAISAAHHRGIPNLLETISQVLPENSGDIEKLAEEKRVKLAIVGRPNVGKSTLMNRLLGEERVIVFDEPGTTRDSIFISLDHRDKKYTLIDTAGVRRKSKIKIEEEKFSVIKSLQAIEAADVVIYMADAREGITEQDQHLLGFITESGKALLIVLNKWDNLSEFDREEAKRSIDLNLQFIKFARIHFISALHGSGVGNLFDSIEEAHRSASKTLKTSTLNEMLKEAVSKHPPPTVRGKRIKLRYAHAGGHCPPKIIIHGNQTEALTDNYKRYLTHYFQEKLKLIGTPLQLQFKTSDNPFKDKKNKLTSRQIEKKRRLMRRVKK